MHFPKRRYLKYKATFRLKREKPKFGQSLKQCWSIQIAVVLWCGNQKKENWSDIQAKAAPVHVMNVYRRREIMAPLSINFRNTWKRECSTSRSVRFNPGERTLVPTDVEAWQRPGSVWREENVLRPGFEIWCVKSGVTIWTMACRDTSKYGCGPTGMRLFCACLEKLRTNKKTCREFGGFGWESNGRAKINRQCHRKSNLPRCKIS
jgi:hypothetical protein